MAGDDIRLTELTNRLEPDMTSPTQRRHDEILGRLDALIDAVQSTTARDHLHRLLAEESAAERQVAPVDTAPDVDPDEALLQAVAEAIDDVSPPPPAPYDADWLDNAAKAAIRAAREHIDAEAHEDVERLTRERDEAEARCERLSVLAEKGERYEALRADVEAERDGAHEGNRRNACLLTASLLARDDERGRDA